GFFKTSIKNLYLIQKRSANHLKKLYFYHLKQFCNKFRVIENSTNLSLFRYLQTTLYLFFASIHKLIYFDACNEFCHNIFCTKSALLCCSTFDTILDMFCDSFPFHFSKENCLLTI